MGLPEMLGGLFVRPSPNAMFLIKSSLGATGDESEDEQRQVCCEHMCEQVE